MLLFSTIRELRHWIVRMASHQTRQQGSTEARQFVHGLAGEEGLGGLQVLDLQGHQPSRFS